MQIYGLRKKNMLPITTTFRLVKSEDLNHHGTFFAGRCAEWFVESAFVCVARELPPNNIVCRNIHGLEFNRPVQLGDVLCFHSCIAGVGRASITVHVTVTEGKAGDFSYTDGFITFVYVDEHGKSQPHGLTVNPETDEEKILSEQAQKLKTKS